MFIASRCSAETGMLGGMQNVVVGGECLNVSIQKDDRLGLLNTSDLLKNEENSTLFLA